ncbi:MAG TPA: hypothetical protein ACFYDZ_00245 [Candidatus Brocadiaceae bacterium]
MNFNEAVLRLKAGEKITREPWANELYFQMKEGRVVCYQPMLDHYPYTDDIMVSEGWIVEDKMDFPMPFSEIIPMLLEGKKARMFDWEFSYIYLDKETRGLLLHRMTELPFAPSFNDFTAEDWQEIA